MAVFPSLFLYITLFSVSSLLLTEALALTLSSTASAEVRGPAPKSTSVVDHDDSERHSLPNTSTSPRLTAGQEAESFKVANWRTEVALHHNRLQAILRP